MTTTSSAKANHAIPIQSVALPHMSDKVLDVEFWVNLKRFYFFGCNGMTAQSIFCNRLKFEVTYNDLTNFEMPEDNEYKDLDKNFTDYLEHAVQLLDNVPELKINVEQLLPFILYGELDSSNSKMKRLPESVEHAYRFIFTLYIDAITIDRLQNLTQWQQVHSIDVNSIQYLKYLIARIVGTVADEYNSLRRAVSLISTSSTLSYTTEISRLLVENTAIYHVESEQTFDTAAIESFLDAEPNGCMLESLPGNSPNTYITEVIEDNGTIFTKPDRLQLIGLVGVRSRVHYACVEGFHSRNTQQQQQLYTECNDNSVWISGQVICDGMCVHLKLYVLYPIYILLIQFQL